MALRADDENSNSPFPGVNYFWQDAEKPPGYDWEQWIQLFEVATLVRHSISVPEVPRKADQQNPRVAALMGNLEETHAKGKIVSLLHISIGKNARKMLMDKLSTINILLIELRELMRYCNECFQIRRNRTSDRHVILSRKQKPSESLNQFWNALNGLAAKCDFGDQTESLVHDIFVLNMANKQVQENCVLSQKRHQPKPNSLPLLLKTAKHAKSPAVT